jgi:hypothetical protein
MPVEIDPRFIALQYVKGLVPDLEKHETAAEAFNDLPNIPWNLRQKIRTLEGKLSGIVFDCIDLVATLGTDEAEDYLEEQWPDP